MEGRSKKWKRTPKGKHGRNSLEAIASRLEAIALKGKRKVKRSKQKTLA